MQILRWHCLLVLCLLCIPTWAFSYYEEEDGAVYETTYNDQQFGDDGEVSYEEFQSDFAERQARPEQVRKPRRVYQRQYVDDEYEEQAAETRFAYREESSSLPSRIKAPGEKVIVVDPRALAWGAYSPKGELIKSGPASAGAGWCADIGRPCRTSVGSFRIFSMGNSDCVSSIYPLPDGGAPMPYCMFFNGGQGLHGSDGVAGGNRSHGCVRLYESDAEWIRYNFASIGTKVIVRPYY